MFLTPEKWEFNYDTQKPDVAMGRAESTGIKQRPVSMCVSVCARARACELLVLCVSIRMCVCVVYALM